MPNAITTSDRTLTPAAQVCLAASVASAVIGLSGLAGSVAVGLAVVALAALLAWGWAGMLNLPSPYGTATVLGVGAVVMAVVVMVDDGTELTWLPAAMGVAVLLTLFHQLIRRDGRPRLVESASATLFGLAIIGSGMMYVPLAHDRQTAWLALAGAVAAGVSAAVDLLGRWRAARPWVVPIGLVVSALVAVLIGAGVETSTPFTIFLIVGMVSAALSHAVRAVMSALPGMAHVRPRVTSAVASVLITGGVVYATIALTTDLIAL